MADSRPLKRIKTTTYEEISTSKRITSCFPMEIVLDITSKVASQSLADIHRLKLTSKEMPNITDDDNTRHGSIFSDLELHQKGLDVVHVASQKGHARSMHAFAMIVLMRSETRIGFPRTQELEKALGYLRFSRNQKCVLGCRNDVAEFIRCLRWNNIHSGLVMAARERLCKNVPCTNTWRLKMGSWCFITGDDDENDPKMCENCRWDHEVEEFCNMI